MMYIPLSNQSPLTSMSETTRDSKLNWTKHIANTPEQNIQTFSSKTSQMATLQSQKFEHIRTKLYNDIHGVAQFSKKAAGVVETSEKLKDLNNELDFFK